MNNNENNNMALDNNKAFMILECEIDDNDFNLKQLKQSFQQNVEKLFIVLTSKLVSLSELSIHIDFPHIIRTNDNYIRVFHKLICNLFINLEYISEKLQSIEINCLNLPIDPINYPILDKFLKKLI